jgi:sulfotransferase family protein
VSGPGTAQLLVHYGVAAARVARRGRGRSGVKGATERPVFVVGSPRSGTTFMAWCLGQLPGFVDLGEVKPLKAAIAELSGLSEEEAAPKLRQTIERIRALGFVRSLRAVEQTPETAFVLGAALRAYAQASVVHMVRDGRDVACSLLEKGWLRDERAGADDVGLPYGGHARPWVELGRVEEFERASEERRAGWAWRSYLTAVRTGAPGALEVRYEQLAADPGTTAGRIAAHIGADPEPLAQALAAVHGDSVGRWRDDLTSEQVSEVETEAGPLLRELGYT